jgi:hypothetical protein
MLWYLIAKISDEFNSIADKTAIEVTKCYFEKNDE